MKRWIAGMMLWMVAQGSLSAAIGETLEQCETRYGKVTKTVLKDDPRGISKVHVFETDDAEIRIRFMDGKAAWLSCKFLGKYNEEQRKKLLDANAAGGKWKLTRDTREAEAEKVMYEKFWLYDSEDKSMQAVLGHTESGMTSVSIYAAKLGMMLGFLR